MTAKNRRAYHVPAHVGILIHEVARKRRHVVDAVLQPLGITRAQRWVMIYLSQIGDRGISQRELAEAMKIGQVAIGERVVLLENAGLIERRLDSSDKRQNLISLTDAGYDVLQLSRRLSTQINDSILDGISPAEKTLVEDVLNRMLANLDMVEKKMKASTK